MCGSLLPTVLNANGNVRDPESSDGRSVPMFALTADSGLNIYESSNVSRNAKSSIPPAAGQGIRSFPRMEAQQSSFTVHHADKRPLKIGMTIATYGDTWYRWTPS